MRIVSIKSFFILACLLITAVYNGYSQTTVKTDTTISLVSDSSSLAKSDSFLDDKVNYKAEDSTTADMINKKAYLYNKAEVYYQDMTLKAGYIEIDFNKKLVVARGVADSTGKIVQRPVFEQGPEKFTAGEITYNFETRKGKIRDVITQQGDGYIHGTDIKKDTNNMYYVARGRYTTCDLEEDPHFYLQAKKIKVIPNDKIITGPAELYIADVPTPLVLPFGYFPNKKGRRSGLIMPGYGESDRLGFYLNNGGFYYGGSEKFDLALQGDIYSNGGFASRATSKYIKRYKYNGSAFFSYSRSYTEASNPELENQPLVNAFRLTWSHGQDSKASLDSRFSALVDVGTASFGKYNGNVNTDYLTTNYSSNINYNKTFSGTPFSLNIAARHSQTVQTKAIDIQLPYLTAMMNRINPFQNSNRIGKRWYDQIGISASLTAINSISTLDTLLFKEGTIRKQLRNGASIQVPITTSFTVLKYFRITPTISTTTNLHPQIIHQRFDKDTRKVITDTLPSIRLSNEATATTGASTMLYGDYFFKTKHLKQIHHVLTPSVSFSYRPDYSQRGFGYYNQYIDSAGRVTEYSIFGASAPGINGPGAGKIGAIGFSLNNTLEAKIKSDTDSGDVYKKLSLLDNFNASISYNAAAEKFKWSPLIISGRTRLFNKLDINSSASFDLYQLNDKGENIDYLEIEKGHLAHLMNWNASIATSLKSRDKTKTNEATPNAGPPAIPTGIREELQYIYDHQNVYVDFSIPWNLNVSYNAFYSPLNKNNRPFTQAITFSGDVSLSKNWKVNASSGFDFITNKLTVTSINIYRDLHCWELHFNWVPFGFRQTFMLEINVKSAMLRDLRLKKQSPNNPAIGL